jgi:integrase
VVFVMARPARLAGSRFPYARKVVPKDVQALLGRTEFRRPLHGSTAAEIKRLHAEALAEWEAQIAAARASQSGSTRVLTAPEVDALCGEYYRAELAEHSDDPGHERGWELVHEALLDRLPDYEPDEAPPAFEPKASDLDEAGGLLLSKGIAADPGSVRRLAVRLWETKLQVAETMMRRARGDWRDDYLPRFPGADVVAPPGKRTTSGTTLTFTALVDAWAKENQPPRKTCEKWTATFAGFAAVIGHDDPRRVTLDDVRQWKQHRLDQGRSLKTVADGVAVMRSTWNWAARNGMLPDKNPFAGMAPKVKKHGLSARDGYTDEQAAQILSAARRETGWLRWMPWLLCFTGARIEEIAELRRRDVRLEGDVWVVDIVPSAVRRGKTDQAQRMIPIHPAVITERFLDYALSQSVDGPLWPDLKIGRYGTRGSIATKKHSRWIRNVVGLEDKRLAPAHSFRHRMEDQLRRARVAPEAQDAITGHHNPRNAGAGYGRGFRGMPDELLEELRRIPSPLASLPAAEASHAKPLDDTRPMRKHRRRSPRHPALSAP